jgi:HlyD family secretion protein
MTKYDKVKHFLTNNKIAIFIGALVIVGALIAVSVSKNDNKKVTIHPTRETIEQVVEVTGNVESATDASLSFEKSGSVSHVYVKVGDRVYAGQTLVTLGGADAYASVSEAQASVASAQATLDQLQTGATPAEIAIKTQAVSNAQYDLDNANSQLLDTVRNTNSTLRDIFDYRLANFFTRNSSDYRLAFSVCDQNSQSQIETDRKKYDTLNVTDIDTAYNTTVNVNNFITSLNSLISLSCTSNDASLADKRVTVSNIKTTISGIFTDISAKKSLLQTAKNGLTRAQKDLDLTKSGTDINRIKTQQAILAQAYARLASARAQAGKNVLTAPFSGIVSQVNVTLGELSSVSQPAVVLISDSAFQIKAKIAEVDIAKLSVGNTATVTLDAYGDVPFAATVTRIDPAATTDGGVPRYGIVLTFVGKDNRIKSGMTANAKIVTETKQNAITVPASYITVKNGEGTVLKVGATSSVETAVQIGIRGSSGKVEVLSGLTESDTLEQMASSTSK